MGIISKFFGRAEKLPVAVMPTANTSSPQMGFMDGVEGGRSLTWAQYQGAGFAGGGGFGSFFGTMPGSEISRERSVAAAVSTDLLTSNTLIATVVENLATYAVGNGLTLSSRPDHERLGISREAARDLSNQIERAWGGWAANPVECDASSRHTLHQLANASYRSYLLTGESVFLMDWLKGSGAASATKVRLLDSRQLDQSVNKVIDGGNVIQGVQFDGQSRLVGYWIRPFVLGSMSNAPQAVFIRARTSWGRARVSHLFDPLVPGQIRGLSPLIAALTSAHAKGTLRELTLAQAYVQAMMTATVESDLPSHVAMRGLQADDKPITAVTGNDGGGVLDQWLDKATAFYEKKGVSLKTGFVNHMMQGDKLKLHRPETPGSNYHPFDNSIGREFAKTTGSSAEDVSGDFSKTSFSASRLAMELPSRINKRRRAAIVERFYATTFRAWLEEACETGKITLPDGAPPFWQAADAYAQCLWRGEGTPVADKLKNAEADILEIANGLATVEQKCGERGLDFEETLAQRTAEMKLFEAAGLSYPQPNNVTISPPRPAHEERAGDEDPLN